MHRPRKWIVTSVIMVLFLGLVGTLAAQAQNKPQDQSTDRTLSPFFFVNSDDPQTDRLPLKSTTAQVRITGVIADVLVTQVYKNEGKKTLEAIYIFPGSTRAAVHAMRMAVGQRVIDAEIMERQKARETYEQARKEGKTASLLEQQRPNVFQMNVANILPGDEIKVELKYTELLEPEDQVYEFVYPAVVGPRYSNTPAAGAPESAQWVENPYLHSGQGAPYTFGLQVDLAAGLPISGLTSPSHQINAEYTGQTQAHVGLKDDPKNGTKDFVLRYQLAGGQIQTGLLLYPGKDENYFLMMMEPPARVPAETVVRREYIFIVDVSGSMNGFPLEQVAKPMMKEIIGGLRPQDFMNVMLFSGGQAVLSERGSLPADETHKREALAFLNSRQGGGGTEILPALKKALALPRTEGTSRIVVVVTDGYVTVEPEVFELIRQNLGQANLFAFGVGSSVNRFIMEGMARTGLGEHFIALNPAEGQKQATRFKAYVDSPVLTGVSVKFEGLQAYDVEPVAVPDLFARRPVIVFGKYKGQATGGITVSGRNAGGQFQKTLELSSATTSDKNSALRLLWARHRIGRLSDLNMLGSDPSRVKEVTDLGLKYGLMTQYTSFVAVDKVKRADGNYETVKQPVPLPEGVSDLAVADQSATYSKGAMNYAAPPAGLSGTGRVAGSQATTTSPKTELANKEDKGRNGDKNAPEKPLETPGGHVRLSLEEIRGQASRPEIENTLRTLTGKLEACYTKAQNQQGGPNQGEVTFRLVIGLDGKIVEVVKLTSTMNHGPTEVCLKQALETAIFTKPTSGTVSLLVKVTFK